MPHLHFWDKEKAYDCRHGDYTGQDDRKGSDAGFPAHLGAYLRVWAAVYLRTSSPHVKSTLDTVFSRVLDMALSRTEKHGFYPFTFAAELTGASPGREVPEQSLRLARHARAVARQLKEAAPAVAVKLERLAALHVGPEKPDPVPPPVQPIGRIMGPGLPDPAGVPSFLHTSHLTGTQLHVKCVKDYRVAGASSWGGENMRQVALLAGALFAIGALTSRASAEDAYPDLPVAEWARSASVSIEDFKGQATALVFYDDNDT